MELTKTFKEFNWNQDLNTIKNNFDESITKIKDGLYIMVFKNPHPDKIVRDNNTKPKTIIRAGGTSIKSGKFEGGLITRIKNYFDHMRVDFSNNEYSHVFNESLCFLKVCDLSGFNIIEGTSAARLLEEIWNKSIEHYLSENQLLLPEQNNRTEWYFTEDINNDLLNSLNAFIGDLCQYTNNFANHLQNESQNLWNKY